MVKQKKIREKHRYIFPNFMAMAMKNADMETQYKSSMMSMALLLIGMVLMGIYSILYLSQGWFFKGLILFNIFAGFLFMSSYLVTTYQQYRSYMDALDFQQSLNLNPNMPNSNMMMPANKVPKKKNRPNQVLFFGGLLIIIAAIASYFYMSGPYKLYLCIGIGLLGLICIISVFFRKPKDRIPKTNKSQIETYEPKPKQGFKKLPKQDIKQQELNKKLQLKIDEMNQQQQIEQEELGITEALEESIEPNYEEPNNEEQQPQEYYQEDYVDYTQTQNLNDIRKKKFKGGGTYYYK